MHRAPRAFIVHDVKFLVKERVKGDLPIFHPLIQEIKGFFIHIIHDLFIFGDFKELSYFLM